MCKRFETDGQKYLKKPITFSKFSEHFIMNLVQGNSY